MARHVSIITAAATLTAAAPSTASVSLKGGPARRWAAVINYEGLAGGDVGSDTFHPIIQTSFDGGTTWQDCASTASMAGGVVAAVTEYIHATTPAAAARVAASDGAIAASTIGLTALGFHVRIKGKITDANANASWRVNSASLIIYD